MALNAKELTDLSKETTKASLNLDKILDFVDVINKNAEEIEGFPLEPDRRGKERHRRIDRIVFARLNLYPDTLIVRQRKKIIDNLETLLSTREIGAADVDQLPELAVLVVAQKLQHLQDRLARNDQRELVISQGLARNLAG